MSGADEAQAPLRMMTRTQFGGGDSDAVVEQCVRCADGVCERDDLHHPRCPRISVQPAQVGSVQIRCGCMATQHCRNTGLPCGGSPCYIVLDEMDILEMAHQMTRTRFHVTRAEELLRRQEVPT